MQGKTINGFELKNRLGVGGMAEVWYAENEIHMAAAVKILNRDLSLNDSIVERFRNEAEIMVKLHHPNIRQVHGYGSIDGRPAIIMEYLEGDDLKARMKQGQHFTNEELVKWWNQLVDALKYTHEEGIVHRDIKPGNIFIDKKGNVKLLDFGIAKVRESISSTQTGQKLGTLMYMSPEQVRDSKHLDYHTDLYSLAVTFVHLLTGKKPYDSDSISDYDIQTAIVTKPLDLNEVPSEWKGFLAPYIEKDPAKRPELRHFEVVKYDNKDEKTVVDSEPSKPEHSENFEKPKKKSKLGLWIALAVAAIAIGVAVLVFSSSSATKEAESAEQIAQVEPVSTFDIELAKMEEPEMLSPKPEPVEVDNDTEMYNSCKNINEYRNYIKSYGTKGKHYNDAKQKVDKHVADSTNKVQEEMKAEQARKEKEQKDKEKADAEKLEYAIYYSCKTIEDCNNYLARYPNGQYVSEVKAKKKELENKIQEEKRRKEQEEKARKEAEANAFTNKTFTVNGVSFDMIAVKGGTFTMGCTSEQGGDCDSDEKPTHSVTLSDYYIGKFEVTQELWYAVMGTTVKQQRDKADTSWPMRGEGNNYPMYYISWNECQEFVRKLNQMTGQNFRLPTEAEWEYAARGGNKSRGYKYSGNDTIGNVAWYWDNSNEKTHQVGTKSPNELGIYDMSGNVWEWCQDWYGDYSSGSQTNPTGPSSGSYRVDRGGSRDGSAKSCRVSNRDYSAPDNRYSILGFRLAAGK